MAIHRLQPSKHHSAEAHDPLQERKASHDPSSDVRSADLDGDLLTGKKHCRVHLTDGSSTNRIAVERGEGAIDATRKGPGQRGIEGMVQHGRNLIA